ncbi:MAG: Ni/Fe-hydrogenase, b-type cytochrome subunit [Rubrivivax sp.]|nr:Ni/Fe-hydrogenase, b-type cytochrome subunit [Rubrivivax sp.]
MQVERWTGRVTGGPLEDTYVYEVPVRIWHWVTVLCFMVLGVTGYFIGAPPPAISGEAVDSFFFGWIRTIHFVTAYVLIAAFLVRVYWVFAGNHHARAIFLPPLWSLAYWRGMFSQAAYYLFLRDKSERWLGHNPMAQTAMFLMFTLGTIVLIVTGLGLYAQGYGWGSTWMNLFGWVTVLLGTPQAVRTAHHLAMWYVLLFAVIHIYMAFREDIMSEASIVGTMVNGIRMWKDAPKKG